MWSSVTRTPSGVRASSIALLTAAGETIAPPSPTPRTLTVLRCVLSTWCTSIAGSSAADGTR